MSAASADRAAAHTTSGAITARAEPHPSTDHHRDPSRDRQQGCAPRVHAARSARLARGVRASRRAAQCERRERPNRHCEHRENKHQATARPRRGTADEPLLHRDRPNEQHRRQNQIEHALEHERHDEPTHRVAAAGRAQARRAPDEIDDERRQELPEHARRREVMKVDAVGHPRRRHRLGHQLPALRSDGVRDEATDEPCDQSPTTRSARRASAPRSNTNSTAASTATPSAGA